MQPEKKRLTRKKRQWLSYFFDTSTKLLPNTYVYYQTLMEISEKRKKIIKRERKINNKNNNNSNGKQKRNK